MYEEVEMEPSNKIIFNDKNIIINTTVLNTINLDSDNRMLRAKVRTNTQNDEVTTK